MTSAIAALPGSDTRCFCAFEQSASWHRIAATVSWYQRKRPPAAASASDSATSTTATITRRTNPAAVRLGGGSASYRVTALTAAGGKTAWPLPFGSAPRLTPLFSVVLIQKKRRPQAPAAV